MPASLPALAANIAHPEQCWPCHSVVQNLLHRPFVPAYRVPLRGDSATRTTRLADAVALLAERLDRLPTAYPHWQRFDPGAYFDLRQPQVITMLRAERLGATLDITLQADLLSPAFRSAARFWAAEFCPAYHAAYDLQENAYTANFLQRALPGMQRRMRKAREEIAAAGELLFERGDTTFLAAAAALDERERHIRRLAASEEDLDLVMRDIPTLTLSRSFDLLEMGK